MRRLVSLTLAAGLAAATLTGVTAPADATSAVRTAVAASSINWGSCDDPDLRKAGAECAFVAVPLDYSRPSGTKIRLAVSRVEHTVPDAQFQGVMLVNPGGPGGSGLIYSTLGQFVPGGAGDAYDWIGFDPRGVGSSEPSLSCIPDYFAGPRPSYEPTTAAVERAWIARSKAYARACARDGGALLAHMKTTDSARDMDSIRKALGADKINYYGFSYGTYLGQVYATLFPDRIRRAVFDSNVDPRRVWWQANLDQDFAFEKVIQKFFAWVAKYDSVYHLGTTRQAVEDNYYTALDKLRANPEGPLGSAEWADAFLLAGYVNVLWPTVADVFAAFVNEGDAEPATELYQAADGVGDDNGYAVYLAVECTDARWPRDWSTWHRVNTRVAEQAPFVTWGNAWFNAPCAFWHAPSGHPVNVNGQGVAPILLIDETLDAATPFTGSLEVRKRFPTSVLLAEPGGTNHAFSLSGNECVDTIVADYLADGTLPSRKPGNGPDARCAPLPPPVPEGARSGSAASGSSRLVPGLVARLGLR